MKSKEIYDFLLKNLGKIGRCEMSYTELLHIKEIVDSWQKVTTNMLCVKHADSNKFAMFVIDRLKKVGFNCKEDLEDVLGDRDELARFGIEDDFAIEQANDYIFNNNLRIVEYYGRVEMITQLFIDPELANSWANIRNNNVDGVWVVRTLEEYLEEKNFSSQW